MSPLHEIAYLAIGFQLACGPSPSPNASCYEDDYKEGVGIEIQLYESPSLHKPLPVTLNRSNLTNFHVFISQDYGTNIEVFETRNSEWDQIRDSNNKEYWIHRPSTKKKAGGGFSYKPLASQLGEMMLQYNGDPRGAIYQEDLETPFQIPDSALKKMKELRLFDSKSSFLDIPTAKIVSKDVKNSLRKAIWDLHEAPNKKASSQKKSSAYLTSNYDKNEDGAAKPTDAIYVFEKKDGWLKVMAKGPGRDYWISEEPIVSLTMESISEEAAAEETANYLLASSEDDVQPIAELTPLLIPRATGRFQWKNGIMWVEFEATNEVPCIYEAPKSKSLFKAWAPYLIKNGKKLRPFFQGFTC